MLNLQLRSEFQQGQTPASVISLRNSNKTGAAELEAKKILDITYPTEDVLNALRTLSHTRPPKPVVLMGGKGRGKSHIMAVMHHAVESPDQVEEWLKSWSDSNPNIAVIANLTLQRGFKAITEPVHNHEYLSLWDLIFDRHPKGQFYRGKFEQAGSLLPPRSLLIEMFETQPIVLILDEFQKWFDGLHNETNGRKWKELASNFIQILSEIATERPDILVLVVSLLNNRTDAFQQIHRNSPVVIDFKGPSARHDRMQLLLHRLFNNRNNIPASEIASLVEAYASERFRLRFSNLLEVEKTRIAAEVVEAWPFSPELLELLEDQILMAEAAQETRDLIRILAQIFMARGSEVPVITPADFFVNEDSMGVQSLLDSISTSLEQVRLRQVAQRNLEAVTSTNNHLPHAQELLSALWMRSMSPGNKRGGTRADLHLDITRQQLIDDNSFQGELATLSEESINVHSDQNVEGRLYFDQSENPRSKVRSIARNNKLWDLNGSTTTIGQATFPGEDINQLKRAIKYNLVSDINQLNARVIVLGPKWRVAPWSEVVDDDKPTKWDKPVLLVIPSPLTFSSTKTIPELGEWLTKHVPTRRNTIRFLFSTSATGELFTETDLVITARCLYLTSIAWKEDPKYRALKDGFDRELKESLKSRFERFAILRNWDFQNPANCIFEIERHSKNGTEIPGAIETRIKLDLFDPDDFQKYVEIKAKESALVGTIITELAEPPAQPGVVAIPYLGDKDIYEGILKVAAKGSIVLNVGSSWVRRLPDHNTDEETLHYIQQKAYSPGQSFKQVRLGLPSDVGGQNLVVGNQSKTVAPSIPEMNGTTLYPAPVNTGYNGVTTPPSSGFAQNGGVADGTPDQPYIPVSLPVAPKVPRMARKITEPATGINLIGNLEKWGLSTSKELDSVKIEVKALTAQQLKEILQRFPSTFKASLEITFLEEDEV